MRTNGLFPRLVPRIERDVYPLSFTQERLWFLWQLEPSSPAYARPLVLRLEGPLNVAALEKALDEVRRRHEVLRANYTSEEGVLRQKIRAWEPWPLATRAISTSAEVSELTKKAAHEPFDLANGPVMRATLLRLAEGENFLLLVFHHIAFDAWSGKRFVEELAQGYGGATLPPLSLQYADYAAWRRASLGAGAWQADLAYWKKQLGGELPVLEWSMAKTRLGARRHAGEVVETEIPVELVSSLKRLARQGQTTLFTVLLAAFKTLIWRYTGETDVIVGCPIAGRGQVETEPLLGCFINMLALRSEVKSETTFVDFLRTIRGTALEAFQYQNVPFEKVIEAVNPPRRENDTPIFQTILNFRNLPETAGAAGDLKFVPHYCPDGIAQFDLSLDLTETDGRLLCRWIYDCEIFGRADVERLAEHYRTLLESVAANPRQTLAKLPLLTAGERRQLLVEWNPPPTEYPKDRCVHELFAEQAEQAPEATALIFAGRSLSYRELNERSNQLANYLRELGAGVETLVGIHLERSAEMVVAMLAVLKAGSAYVPLDPSYPQERIKYMLGAADVPILITQQSLVGALGSHQARVISIDGPELDHPTTKPIVPVTAENLAYVIFTSGSTGQPKGVQITHRSLVNFLSSARRQPGIDHSDVWLAVATLSFDIAALEIFLPLISGACVVVADRESTVDGRQLRKLLEECRATIMQATPTTWRLLREAGWTGSPDLKILVGGEACPPELARMLVANSVSAWNMYGPTETTIYSTVGLLEAESKISIGRVIDNTKIYIVGPGMEPVPVGVAGELLIGGDGLARAYLNDPDLTAEKFIPDPFSEQGGGRLYKTGDRARYWPDRRIEWLGRMDQQIKIRGFRVELGEIEAVLASHPAVQQAVVILRKANSGELQLAAYVVKRMNTSLAPGELRALAKSKLPDYMAPVSFVMLTVMPLTPNGKVDRKALQALQPDTEDRAASFAAPRSATECGLAEIWGKVLKVEKVGRHDNFFDLGGHSLLAMRLMWEVRKRFEKTLPLSALFTAPTIEQLAKLLENKNFQNTENSANALRGAGAGAPLFHIPGMWGYEFLPEPVAREIGKVRRFHDGLQYAGMDGKQPPATRIEEMAAHLVAQIQQICPHGPYCLSGYSFGGGMAVEVARQLQAKGEEVEAVLLWDSFCPNGNYRRRSVLGVLQAIRQRWGSLEAQARLPFLQKLIGTKMAGRQQFLRQWWQWHFRFLRPHNFAGNAHLRVERAIQAAKGGHRPEPYAGRVILFQVEDQEFTRLWCKPDALNGWGGTLTGEFKLIVIPGDHTTAVQEPTVSIFAAKMRDSLIAKDEKTK